MLVEHNCAKIKNIFYLMNEKKTRLKLAEQIYWYILEILKIKNYYEKFVNYFALYKYIFFNRFKKNVVW